MLRIPDKGVIRQRIEKGLEGRSLFWGDDDTCGPRILIGVVRPARSKVIEYFI